MATEAITQKEFRDTMAKLTGMVATKDDLKELVSEVRETRQQLTALTDSVDKFSTLQSKDHDELVVLRARYDRIVRLLVEKGIVKEQELGV